MEIVVCFIWGPKKGGAKLSLKVGMFKCFTIKYINDINNRSDII